MKFLNYFILMVLFSIKLVGATDIVFPKKISKKKPITLTLQNEYFYSKENYTQLGQHADLPSKNSFSYSGSKLALSYSPWPWLYLETFMDTVLWSRSLTNNFLRGGFSFTEGGLGLSLRTYYKGLSMHVDIQSAYSFEKALSNTDEIILSDGAHWLQSDLWLTYEYKKMFYIFSNLGFRYRTAGLSGLNFYKIGGIFQSPIADFGFSTNLIIPLIVTDAYYQNPDQRLDVLKRVNGGSYKFHSLHPVHLSYTAWMQWNFPVLNLKVYFNLDSYGKNSARGLTIGLENQFIFNTRSLSKRNKKTMLKKYKKSIFQKNKKRNQDEYDDESPYVNEELQEELNSLRY